MKKTNRKYKPSFAYPKKAGATIISEFEIMHPTQEGEVAGQKLVFHESGEYWIPEKHHHFYNLLFLLDHPVHYRISKVVMQGIQYIIPVDRKKNWLPQTHPDRYKFIVK